MITIATPSRMLTCTVGDKNDYLQNLLLLNSAIDLASFQFSIYPFVIVMVDKTDFSCLKSSSKSPLRV